MAYLCISVFGSCPFLGGFPWTITGIAYDGKGLVIHDDQHVLEMEWWKVDQLG